MTRTNKMLKGIGQVGSLSFLQKIFNFISLIVLARLLTPTEFGVVTAGMILVNFANMFTNAGVATTLIQFKEIDDKDIRVGLTLSMLISICLYFVISGSSLLMADFMNIPELRKVIPIISIILMLTGFNTISGALMQRYEKVFLLTIIQTSCSIGSVLFITIPMALTGYSYWSLVAGELTKSITMVIITYWLARHPVKPYWEKQRARRLFTKGTGFFVSRFFSFLSQESDNVIVGRYFGADALGYYGRSYRLMDYPSSMYTTIVDRLVFPAMSRIQDEQVRMQAVLLRGLSLTALFSLPLSAFFIVSSEELVTVLFGPEWLLTGQLLAVLGGFTFFRVSWKVFSTYFRALGKVKFLIVHTFFYAMMMIIGAGFAAQYDMIAVAWAVGLAISLNWLLILWRTKLSTDLKWSDFIQCFTGPLLLSILLLICLLLVRFGVGSIADQSAAIVLLIDLCVCLAFTMAVIITKPRRLLGDQGLILQEILSKAAVKSLKKVSNRKAKPPQ